MKGTLIGRVRGIEIRVSWGVAIIASLITWSLASEVLPDMVGGRSEAEYWTAGALGTVGFLAALLAHELGHSLVAQSHDVGVKSITLWILGGVAQLERQPQTADVAIRIAAAGPAVSVLCGVAGVAAGVATGGLVSAVLIWFGWINLLLAVFNLLPAFPLDGGRVYQAWLWRKGLTQERATEKAARLGGRIGQVIVWIGVFEVLVAGLLGGLWLMAIGWFLREASVAEAEGVRRESTLRRFTAAEVMTPHPMSVQATGSIAQFVKDAVVFGRHAAYPVCDETNNVVGLLDVKSVRALPVAARATTAVAAVMTPLAEIPVGAPDDTVDALMRAMDDHDATRALIMDGDVLAGIVAPSDIVRLTMAVELADSVDA